MILIARRKTLLVLGWFAVASLPTIARAQGNVFNPYGNSGYADYREFAVPMYSNNPALPNQARLQSQPLGESPYRANQFEQYLNGIDELGSSVTNPNAARGPAPAGMPYYRSYRRFDRQYDRVYTPNNTPADKAFNDRMRLRDEKYAQALKETDPAKRAQLLRQVQGLSLDRPAAKAPARATPGSPATPRASRPRTTAPPAPATTPAPASADPSGAVPYPRGYSPSDARTAPRPKAATARPKAATAPTSPAPTEPAPAAPAPR